MPTLYETLRADIILALKARDSGTALALRTADAAIQRAAMDTNKPIDDALATATLRKAVKNLTDAKTEFEKGGRPDLVAANSAEIARAGADTFVAGSALFGAPQATDPNRYDTIVAALRAELAKV